MRERVNMDIYIVLNKIKYESKSTAVFQGKSNCEKRKYNENILRGEDGSVTPLVFTINVGMGKEADKSTIGSPKN